MKFVLLMLSALIAVVMGKDGVCDTEKLSFQFFKDKKCTMERKFMTKKYGKLSGEYAKYYDGKCHKGRGVNSWVVTCDAKSMKAVKYGNTPVCKGTPAKTRNLKFGDCKKLKKKTWVKVISK